MDLRQIGFGASDLLLPCPGKAFYRSVPQLQHPRTQERNQLTEVSIVDFLYQGGLPINVLFVTLLPLTFVITFVRWLLITIPQHHEHMCRTLQMSMCLCKYLALSVFAANFNCHALFLTWSS
ncbi:hypothetical protein SEVIR_6G121854v4 [Setaria viridis]|uniref:Uncharacterized protein n=1 Tax=Setaria viridis TaxID=4556 RepID=A0A4U6U2L8_SETVI|nr:hypothetical protein SEVIR_6G121854v2 [Setaria viridis]